MSGTVSGAYMVGWQLQEILDWGGYVIRGELHLGYSKTRTSSSRMAGRRHISPFVNASFRAIPTQSRNNDVGVQEYFWRRAQLTASSGIQPDYFLIGIGARFRRHFPEFGQRGNGRFFHAQPLALREYQQEVTLP